MNKELLKECLPIVLAVMFILVAAWMVNVLQHSAAAAQVLQYVFSNYG